MQKCCPHLDAKKNALTPHLYPYQHLPNKLHRNKTKKRKLKILYLPYQQQQRPS